MIPPEEGIECAEKQQDDYKDAICYGTRHGVDIGNLQNTARGLQPMPKYAAYSSLRFVYELLNIEDPGVTQQVKSAVDAWLQDENNIQRVERHVKRGADAAILRGYGVFRLKAQEGPSWMELSRYSFVPGWEEEERPKPQTLVFIALDALDVHNGFFISLKAGQDVCIDSAATIVWPPTGGGLGIVVWLNI